LLRIDDIRAEAERMGINGIPTFIIGKERIVGCQPYQVVAEAVIRVGGQRRS
jgi:predicted DsbA family dithiol-disulfide isomerase